MTDPHAMPADQIDVTLDCPRTPFNLASAMVALADELRALDGNPIIMETLARIERDCRETEEDYASETISA